MEPTIEEREENEPHLAQGVAVSARGDDKRMLREIDSQVDVMMRDGGNHGWLGVVPDFEVVATPMDVRRLIRTTKPRGRVSDDVEDRGLTLTDALQGAIGRAKQS